MSYAYASAVQRGWASRLMLAEDARWAMDVVLSAQRVPKLSPYIALIVGHHFVRIAYEGADALRSPNPHVGFPVLADLLQDQFAAVTARGRHVTKLLDDKEKSYTAVLDELGQIITEHRSTFTGKSVRWARRFETDLGLYLVGKRPLGASWPTAYRLGLSVEPDGQISGHDLLSVTHEWGGTLAVLGGAALDATEPTATLNLTLAPRLVGKDTNSDRYLRRRFEHHFPDAVKLLLLGIEGEMNTSLTFLPHTESGHEYAVFRTRTVTLYHSLTALERIAERYAFANSPGMRALNKLLASSEVAALLSMPGKMVRNRCTHYEIADPRVTIDGSLPMFGIIESVFPGKSWSDFNDRVMLVTERLAELLGNWTPR